MTSLLVEMALLSPLALGWLLWQAICGTARRLKMTTLGVLQFIPPACFLLLGS
jgi:EamA domain-containing membrane protein RarD